MSEQLKVKVDLTSPYLNIRCTRVKELSKTSKQWVHEMLRASYTPRWAEDGDRMDDAMFDVIEMGEAIEKFAAATGEDDVIRAEFDHAKVIDAEIRSLVAQCTAAGIDYVQVDQPNANDREE